MATIILAFNRGRGGDIIFKFQSFKFGGRFSSFISFTSSNLEGGFFTSFTS